VTLTSAGVLAGTPGYVAQSYPITITATADGVSATQSFVLTVAASNQLRVTTTSLPPAPIKEKYSTSLAAAGGTAPYKWKKTGKLPKGLVLKTNGTISGKPTKTAVTSTFTVTVTDSSHPKKTASATLTITVP
jgi:hypothetical protein